MINQSRTLVVDNETDETTDETDEQHSKLEQHHSAKTSFGLGSSPGTRLAGPLS